MANRRARIQDFYSRSSTDLRSLVEKAAAEGRFAFHGPAVVDAVVVRTDLNGYSSWARDKQAGERAAVLDEFFTRVVPLLNGAGGVYFRDEGDCIVSLFSNYFGPNWSYASAEAFCMFAGTNEYGKPKLTAKSTVACGRIAVYQKAHEVGSEDWSAEGDAFVRAGRLEAAITSKQQIAFFADDYHAHFLATNVGSSGTPRWIPKEDKLQVQGLGASGGWTDVVFLEHRQPQQPATLGSLAALRAMRPIR